VARLRAEGIDSAEGKQKIIVELYDKFFRNAFPKMSERLGIVYTPVEIVDFILKSVDHLLRTEFGQTLGSEGVHILDPFAGTGTFITRLFQSGFLTKEELARKYKTEFHANEIVLLAYYIAAINIELAYHGVVGGKYQPFEGSRRRGPGFALACAAMKTIHLEHEIQCEEDTFWRVFLDASYTKTLFREVLGFPQFEILREEEVDGVVHRECAAQPKLPRAQMALARLLRRRGFHFIERGRFDKAKRSWSWDLEPNVWRSLLSNRGTLRVERLDGGRGLRIVDIELGARIPGLAKRSRGPRSSAWRAAGTTVHAS